MTSEKGEGGPMDSPLKESIFFHWLWRSDHRRVGAEETARFKEGFVSLGLPGLWEVSDSADWRLKIFFAEWLVVWDMAARIPVKEFRKLEPLCRERTAWVAGVRFGSSGLAQVRSNRPAYFLFEAKSRLRAFCLGRGWTDPEPPLLAVRREHFEPAADPRSSYAMWVRSLLAAARAKNIKTQTVPIQWIYDPKSV